MKIDGGLMIDDLAKVPERARALEAAGYDGAVTAEVSSDPFLPLALAAEHTERIELLTSIAVAFARNPMTMAQIAHDAYENTTYAADPIVCVDCQRAWGWKDCHQSRFGRAPIERFACCNKEV